MNIEVNKKAPAYHEAKIEIHRSAEEIYKILSDINRWPHWQEDVKHAKVFGDFKAGTKFVWNAGGFKIKSKIHTATPNTEIGWTGSIFWIKAIHNWHLTPSGSSTLVIVKESIQGLGAGMMQKALVEGITKNLYELKIEAENFPK
ncbi:SRPBCC family protein [Sunxiuqinia sp. A32]|uniref:SRPBCC family protein n=1 Tax=Sunxiuqinia sp. A32 TaxID=3461496 RepID=UPI004045F1EF